VGQCNDIFAELDGFLDVIELLNRSGTPDLSAKKNANPPPIGGGHLRWRASGGNSL